MAPFLDARVPVRFAPLVPGESSGAWLVQGDGPVPEGAAIARFTLPSALPVHPADCACCQPRGAVALALSQLFLARARGEVPYFRAVMAVNLDEAGQAAIRAALASDPFLLARFRLDDA